MNNDFKKLISNAKKIDLSPEKKDSIRARLQNFIDLTPIQQKNPQPLRSKYYISSFSILNMSKVVSFVLIILITGGSTISYASEDTLPGDTLYTVKVNFKEPIEEGLAFGPQAKLEVKTKQVEKRLTEAQVLIKKNDLTPEKHKEVEARVEKKVEEISQKIDELQEKGDVETILATTSKLQPVLKAHQEALQKEIDSKKTDTQEDVVTAKTPETNLARQAEPETLEVSAFAVSEVAIEAEPIQPETKKEIQSDTTIENLESFDTTANLLKTVEKTIVRVEEKEHRALETVGEIEKDTTTQERISTATDKKVEQAQKEITDIKNKLETEIIETTTPSPEVPALEDDITQEVTALETAVKHDSVTVAITEAEILLEESKVLYEEGLYKESLSKAQEAIKITTMIETSQKIETAQQETLVTTPTREVKSSTEILQPVSEIKIEDQASQAIRSLEQTLEKGQ